MVCLGVDACKKRELDVNLEENIEQEVVGKTLAPLERCLPPVGKRLDSGELLVLFLDYVKEKGIELYPAQERPFSTCLMAAM